MRDDPRSKASCPPATPGWRASRRDALRLALGTLAAGAAPAAWASALVPGPRAGEPPSLLILGGTGFLGPHLTEAALALGWRVAHFNRGRRRPEGVPGVEQLTGDRDGKLAALQGRRFDAVIDNSGYVPRIVRQSAELLAPNVGQYLFVSSISVYARLAEPNDERGPLATIADPTIEKVDGETFGALKALCEQAVEGALPGRTTIVRPGYIVGPLDPTDRFTYWPVRVARGGEMLAPGTAGDPIQVVDVRDLAAWMLGLVEARRFGAFNAVSPPRHFTIGGLLQASRRVTGSDARFTWVPASFLEQQTAAGLAVPIWVPPAGAYAGLALTTVERALATGLSIRPLEETVRDTLAWHRTRPAEQQQKLRAGLDAEREAAILAAWHAGTKERTS